MCSGVYIKKKKAEREKMSTGHECFPTKDLFYAYYCCCWKAMRNEKFSFCHKTAAFAYLFPMAFFTSAIFICLAGGQKAQKKLLFICDDNDDYDEIAVLSMLELFGSLVGNKQHRVYSLILLLCIFDRFHFLLGAYFFVYKCWYPVVFLYLFRLWKMKITSLR